jgi:hypothetical protein
MTSTLSPQLWSLAAILSCLTLGCSQATDGVAVDHPATSNVSPAMSASPPSTVTPTSDK